MQFGQWHTKLTLPLNSVHIYEDHRVHTIYLAKLRANNSVEENNMRGVIQGVLLSPFFSLMFAEMSCCLVGGPRGLLIQRSEPQALAVNLLCDVFVCIVQRFVWKSFREVSFTFYAIATNEGFSVISWSVCSRLSPCVTLSVMVIETGSK